MGGIGILGGTFNPVHNGHVRHAVEVAEALGLERVALMPCATPPHKESAGLLPFALRVELLRAAVKGIPFLKVETLEGELSGPSYTWRTLNEWARRHEGEPLPYFMMGAEAFAALDTWNHGLKLPQVAHLVMVPRGGDDGSVFHESIRSFWPGSLPEVCDVPLGRETVELAGGGRCTFLPVPRLDISSTFIRARWRSGRSLAALMSAEELAVLHAHAEEVSACWATARPR
ncbi:nicotinate (nicotinamide) nucleotide adenylyltransferase [Mailhella massiliensis]|uniref:Probable nicotinate-nucleotide adenylyltransferase n=1 Tax=Mailhella massiliensis TaxID=1903261 RepID=A0A921AV17_9BACT|nr:nicotinate (nicotinamide) nucleotide adenylyltransferase [Mailhella massiliensis]HJD96415.1 nicotinate (nicotinamide) nucleotide adenylyltransferase [Mailhella massiliensis]